MSFNAPINSLAPHPIPSDWVRPSDWPLITDAAGEIQFLVSNDSLKAFSIETTFVKNSGNNIYIDWGDGVVDTISTTTIVTTSHVYSTGGTPCSRGYNTFKIRIYGDATCVITNAKHQPNIAVTGATIYYNIGVLEAYYGDGTMSLMGTSLFASTNATGSVATFNNLEYVKLPSTVAWTSNMQYMFASCANLYVVIMPTSASNLTNLTNTFFNCNNLREITIPSNATEIASFSNTFANCRSLKKVSFPSSLNLCSSFNACFTSCYSLKNITFPSVNACTDFANMLQNCTSLQWVKFEYLPAPITASTSIFFTASFQGCTSLQNVYFPNSVSSNGIYSMGNTFSGCFILKNIIFPTSFNASSINSCFLNCYNLTNVTFPTSMVSLADCTNAFQSCYALKTVNLPTTVSASINLQGMFQSCYTLETMTIPSGWTLSNIGNIFSNCYNIKTIILPNNSQNSLTLMASAFNNCYKVKSITLPTSLNTLNSLSTVFNNCQDLTSVIFPASLPAVTSMSTTFTNCYSLSSLTLPTSMVALNNLGSTFNNCYNLETITLPSTTGLITSYTSAFNNCIKLKTITLPTTQSTTLSNITFMLAQCPSLTTINNISQLGSLTAIPLVSAASFTNLSYAITSLSFNCPFSQLTVNGVSNINFNKLNSLRLLNTGTGQWTGTSPQVNVSYCDLGVAALNQLFTDLTTIVGKTINITGCTGAVGCTRTIATAKGWTVTG